MMTIVDSRLGMYAKRRFENNYEALLRCTDHAEIVRAMVDMFDIQREDATRRLLIKAFSASSAEVLTVEDISLEALITGKFESKYVSLDYSDWLAFEIDRDNAEIVRLADEILCTESAEHKITEAFLGGILKSGNRFLLDRLCQWLSDAQRQEGLRRAIVEIVFFDQGKYVPFLVQYAEVSFHVC